MTPVRGDLSFLHYPPDDWWHLFVVVPLGTAIGQVSLVAFWEFINSLATLAYAVVGMAVVATFIVVAIAALKLAWEGWDG